MVIAVSNTPDAVAPKRHAVLEAAVSVFARYGFRKTSMDEVARAAGVSRQGLYLQFADKEALFRHAVDHKLTCQLSATIDVLSNPGESLEARLVAACDEWSGRYVGAYGGDAADLMCASTSLAGDTLAAFEKQFEAALTAAISASPLAAFCRSGGFAPADLAHTLHATARGLKQTSKTRQEFMAGIAVAARMYCAPLDGGLLSLE